MKAVLRGKFIALSAFIKKLLIPHTSNLTTHLKTLQQKEANTPKRSRWQKIIKLRTNPYPNYIKGQKRIFKLKSEMKRGP